jgi:hypothetical protein
VKQLSGNQGLLNKFQQPHCFDNLLWYFAMQHDMVSDHFEVRKRRKGMLQEGAKAGGNGSNGTEQQPRNDGLRRTTKAGDSKSAPGDTAETEGARGPVD